jgi:predicted acetyltransferase
VAQAPAQSRAGTMLEDGLYMTNLSPEISVQRAQFSDNALLENLLELYVHDMSEMFSVKIGAEGRFGYEKLPLYWSEPETHFAFLIRSGNDIAGFALVTRGSPASDDPNVLDMSEFFILRSHRRSGIGRRATFLLWDQLRGNWVVRVSERNRGALPFWEEAVRKYTHGAYSEKKHPGKTHLFQIFMFANQ